MPGAVTFRITTYRKLARGEHGLTQLVSRRMVMAEALRWILGNLPDEAVNFRLPTADVTIIEIDWSAVPDSIRRPALPRGR